MLLSVCIDASVLALAFLSVCTVSFACPCFSQCLCGLLYLGFCVSISYGLLCLFLSGSMDSCACACVFQCLYELLCLCLSVFVWTLVLALSFRSVCMDFCTCACVSQCLYELVRFCFSVFVWTLVLALSFDSVCMDSCACAFVSQYKCTESDSSFVKPIHLWLLSDIQKNRSGLTLAPSTERKIILHDTIKTKTTT